MNWEAYSMPHSGWCRWFTMKQLWVYELFIQSLYSRGFTGYQRPLIVSRPTGGATYPETYSFDDFCIVIEYEAEVGHNPKAIALLTASFRELISSW